MMTLLFLAVLACLFAIGYSLKSNNQPQVVRIPVENRHPQPQRRRRR